MIHRAAVHTPHKRFPTAFLLESKLRRPVWVKTMSFTEAQEQGTIASLPRKSPRENKREASGQLLKLRKPPERECCRGPLGGNPEGRGSVSENKFDRAVLNSGSSGPGHS